VSKWARPACVTGTTGKRHRALVTHS